MTEDDVSQITPLYLDAVEQDNIYEAISEGKVIPKKVICKMPYDFNVWNPQT